MADYEADDGPLTESDLQWIREAAARYEPKGKVLWQSRSLLDPTTLERTIRHAEQAPERFQTVAEIVAELDREDARGDPE